MKSVTLWRISFNDSVKRESKRRMLRLLIKDRDSYELFRPAKN